MVDKEDYGNNIVIDFGRKGQPSQKDWDISELEKAMLAGGDIIDDRRDWTMGDAFKQGVRNVLTPNPHALDDYEHERLIGLSNEEFQQKAGRMYQVLGALDPETRDKFLQDEIAGNQRYETMMKGIADYIAPPSEEPYKKPEGFLDNALYKIIEAIPSLGATAAEIATIGVPLTIGHQTFSGHDAANEAVFSNLVSQGMSPEQAYNVATDKGINMQDLALRGLTNVAAMYFLGKTPVANIGGASPYMQTAGNIGAAAVTSGVGSAAEQAVTNARADVPNDPLELAKTGGASALTTGALGAYGAFRNRRYLRGQQALHNLLNENTINASYTDMGEIVDPKLQGGADKAIPPNEPIFPSDTEVITVPEPPTEVIVGQAPIVDPAANARQQTFSGVMMKHGLNPEAGTAGIAVAYRNGIIDDLALNDIANVLAPNNPTQVVDMIKADAVNAEPLVKAENVPIGDMLNPPQIKRGMDIGKPQAQRVTDPNELMTDYFEGKDRPQVKKGDITDPLFAPPSRGGQVQPQVQQPVQEQPQDAPFSPKEVKQWEDPLMSKSKKDGLSDEQVIKTVENDPLLKEVTKGIKALHPKDLKNLAGELYPNLSPEKRSAITPDDLVHDIYSSAKRVIKKGGSIDDFSKAMIEVLNDPTWQTGKKVKPQEQPSIAPVSGNTSQPQTPEQPKAPESKAWTDPLNSSPKPTETKETQQPQVQGADDDDEGYINSIEVLSNGDKHGAHVYLDKTPEGIEYLDIADDNGESVAVYNPATDEFFIRPEAQRTGWVRELEDTFRDKLKPSESIIKAANEGKLSDGLYDFFGFGLDEEDEKKEVKGNAGQPPVSEPTKQKVTPPSIAPLGQSEKEQPKGKQQQQDNVNERLWGNWGYDDKLPPLPKQPKRDASPEEWTNYARDLLTYLKAKQRLDEYNAEINNKLYIQDAREAQQIRNLEKVLKEAQEADVKEPVQSVTPLTGGKKAESEKKQSNVEHPAMTTTTPAPETKPTEAIPAPKSEDDKVAKAQQLADRVNDAISSGKGFKNNNDFAAAANEVFGGTRGQGVHSVKDDYDAMEMGVNKFILEQGINPSAANDIETAKSDLAKINEFMNLLPTQANRTEEQNKLQQFSTPPNLAYVVSWLADIQEGDVVLEPSAGLGGLAVFAKNAGGKLILNEYSRRRAGLLKSMNLGDVYTEDALSLNNILRPRFEKNGKRFPNKVIMNPPFSVTTSADKKSADNAIKHVEQALEFMADGGRLVAILGARTTSRPAWDRLAEKYNVRTGYDLDGSNYRKYGTTYNNQIVVIDKTPRGVAVYHGLPFSGNRPLEDIFKDLKDIRDSAPKSEYTEPEAEESHAEDNREGNKIPSTLFDKIPRKGEFYSTMSTYTDPTPHKELVTFERETSGVNKGLTNFKTKGGIRLATLWDDGEYTKNKSTKFPQNDLNDQEFLELQQNFENYLRGLTPNETTPAMSEPKPSEAKPAPKAETPKPSKPVEPAKPKAEQPSDSTEAKPKAKPKKQKNSDLDSEGKKEEVLPEWETDGKKRRSISEIVNSKDTVNITSKGTADLAKEQKAALEKEAKLNAERGTPAIATRYITSLNVGTLHPANVNEAISLAAQPLPPLKNKKVPLPKEMIDSGAISSAQLEAVAYALQANEEINTIGEVDYNCAAFLADGTGMGKGRTIAAFIHATMAKGYGNGKAVWVSVNAKRNGLFTEGQGHYADIGDDPHDIFSQSLISAKSKIKRENGILFTAYSTLRTKSGADSGKFPRIEQMCEWLGEDFDGAIVLDECHTANNLVSTKGKRGKTKTSDTATVIAQLQARYPKAKILYASATGATELKQLAAYPRLGIWGEEQSFKNEQDFRYALQSSGLAGMELVIRSLKAQGRWFARSLSMEDVTFRTLNTPLTEQQTLIYNEVGRAWIAVQKSLKEATRVVTGDRDAKTDAKLKMTFHGARQRAMNMLITYFKVPAMIADIEEQLKAGKSIVIQLTNTNEPKKGNSKKEADDEFDESEDINFNISPITSLIELIKEKYPIYEIETYEDENQKKQTRVKKDSLGNPVVSAKAKAMRDELINNIKSIPFRNPLDMIINHFGADNVVEVTGRSQRQVDKFKEIDGVRVKAGTETQKWGKDKGMADKKNFDDGKKRILIFSEAGGTGVSYHAGRQFKNQQQRVHYLLQAGWRAETAMQGLGRTHRTNQAHAPEYVLVSTDVPGERRFLSSIARRLLQLGALSSGERKSTTQGIFSARDNLESNEAKAALTDLVRELLHNRYYDEEAELLIDVIDPPTNQDGYIIEKEIDFSKTFNGLLAVPVDVQKRIYAKFDKYLNTEIQRAIENGTLDLGTENLKGEHIRLIEEADAAKEGISATYRVFEVENTVKYRTWNKLNMSITLDGGKIKKLTPNDFEFFVKKSNGEIFATIKSWNDGDVEIDRRTREAVPCWVAYSPKPKSKITIREDHLKKGRVDDDGELVKLYDKVSDIEEAEKLWNEYIEKQPKTKKTKQYILSGSLLPVLGLLQNYNNLYQRGESPLKVLRVVTDDKKQYLGVVIPKQNRSSILHALEIKDSESEQKNKQNTIDTVDKLRDKLNKTKEKFDYRIKLTLSDGDSAYIWQQVVNGEKRVVADIPFYHRPSFRNKFGLFSETINYEENYFIPNTDEALQKLVDEYPLMEFKGDKKDDNDWEDINEEGVRVLNDDILSDEDVQNMYIIPPSFRKFFGFGATAAEAQENAEKNPYVFSVSPEYQSSAKEVEARIEGAHDKHKTKQKPIEIVKEFAHKVWRGTSRAYELEGKPHMAKALNIIDQFKQARRANVQQVLQAFRVIFDKLTPDEYALFERYMLVQDLAETYALDEGAPLPYSYTPETLAEDLKHYVQEVDKNPKVKEAIRKAESYGNKLCKDLIKEADKLGLYDIRDKLTRKHYFRHLVLDYYLVEGGGNVAYATMRNPANRSFLRRREGSYKDISSNWIQAMGEVYVRMTDTIKVMGALSQLREEYDIIEQLKEYAMKENMERAIYGLASTLKDIPTDGLREAALKKLDESLLKERAKAVSQLFKLAQQGDLPVGLDRQWEELVNKMASAGQLEKLSDEDRRQMSRYVGWLVSNNVEAFVTPSMKVDTTAKRMAKHIIKGEAIKRRKLEKALGDAYVHWQDLIPDDCKLWSPMDSGLIIPVTSVPEYALKIAEDNLDEMLGIPLSDIGKALQSGGDKQMWVIPEGLADVLDRMGKKQPLGSFGKINKFIMTNFKKWVILNPFKGRGVLYNIRNGFGDFESVLQGNPMAVKYIPQAIRELYNYMIEGAIPTGKLKEFVDRGGALTTEFASELDEWSSLREFQHLAEQKKGEVNILKLPAKFVHVYTDIASSLTNYREAILRYASFLSFIDLINENGGKPPFYGMSKKMEVDAMEGDVIGMAFKLSNENLGAFDEVSENTQYLRDNSLMMFGSWIEVNFKRTMQLFRNTMSGDDYLEYYFKRMVKSLTGAGGGGNKIPPSNSGGVGSSSPNDDGDIRGWRRKVIGLLKMSPVLGLRYLKYAAIIRIMLGILSFINWFNPNEDKLSPKEKDEPHLVLWEDDYGNVLCLNGLGATYDALKLDLSAIFFRDVAEIMSGRETVGGMLSNMVSAPMNKALQNLNPVLKFAIESITGTKTYPDYRDRVKIKDPVRYLAQTLNLDWYYDALTGKPVRPFGEIMPTVSGKGMESYFYILGKKKQFQEQVLGMSSGGFTQTPRTEALANARRAIEYDYTPEEVNKYIGDYYNAGGKPSGIKQSLSATAPMAGLTKVNQARFWAWLSKEDREQLEIAERYHKYVSIMLRR